MYFSASSARITELCKSLTSVSLPFSLYLCLLVGIALSPFSLLMVGLWVGVGRGGGGTLCAGGGKLIKLANFNNV